MKKIVITIVLSVGLFIGASITTSVADEIDDIIPAIIQTESGGNPNAVSRAGCIGLMQINPRGALAEYNQQAWVKANIGELYNPAINVRIGEWYLRRLKNHYLKDNYTIERMLAAYNGGITRLRKHNYDISKMPRETRQYVKKVMKIYRDNK